MTFLSCLDHCFSIIITWPFTVTLRVKYCPNFKGLEDSFPDGSAGKESTRNAGDPGSIPGSGRSPGEGIDYPLQYSWASLVAQLVKNPAALQETWVWSLGWEDPLDKGRATHSSILAWRIPWTVESRGLQRVRCEWATSTSEDGKIFGLFAEDTSQTSMGTVWWLDILLSWLSSSALCGFLTDLLGVARLETVCSCSHTAMVLWHHIFEEWLTDVWLGKVLGTAPLGQLMSDTNLCISLKAANMVLCVNHSAPWVLGINTNKSKSNLLYEVYRLPACWRTHARSVTCE